MRLNRFLAQRGPWSRRRADELIRSSAVRVNGTVATLGMEVSDHDEVTVEGKNVGTPSSPIYLLLNKPVGYLTSATAAPDTVYDLLPSEPRIFPVGRLDVESSGLMLFTNDGFLAERLAHPRYQHEKEYDVTVDKPLTDAALEALSRGVILDRRRTLPAKVKRLSSTLFRIGLKEGRNRQIRRMCDELGYTVTRLKRIRIMSLTIEGLAVGRWRELSAEEITRLKTDLEIEVPDSQ